MDGAKRPIRTPDQRIRVFISSTLKELEPERRAVREVVERLHLAPVMFELGARPHPPRALYRSYLDQSDIFVGLYWERYGWVAPDETVSGLEDEYRLSGSLPLLIYIKEPAPEREARLIELLAAIRDDDRSSYKSFSQPEDLAELVLSDIATLLAERFDASVISTTPAEASGRGAAGAGIPAPYTGLVGRERERAEIAALLARRDVRILSIVGPGGVGKSRLAIEIAMDAAAAGREVAFATLESVAQPERVITALARALGVRDTGDGPLDDKVIEAIADRDLLLIVDNMEHLLGAAGLLVRLVTECSRLQLLVTSRSPLRVRAERVFTLPPLEVPATDADADDVSHASAVELFQQRAAAVNPSFQLTAENTAAVVAICRALDGMPLAIELAAARVRTLSPAQILERLDSALTLLVSGARDLPERQRALSRTIQWSVDLLDAETRRALALLSVFSGTFGFASAERVLNDAGIDDPFGALEALVDASLLGHDERGRTPAFRLLSLVRAYAATLLSDEEHARAVAAWVDGYRDLGARAAAGLRGTAQLEWLERLELESENLASVMRALLDGRELDEAADYAWSLYLYLWIGGYLGLVQSWMSELLTAAADGTTITPHSRAIALYYVNAVRFWQDPGYDPVPGLTSSRDLFLATDDDFGAALASVSLALAFLARGEQPDFPAAIQSLEHSLDDFRTAGDAWGEAMALVMLGRIDMLAGDIGAALQRFEASYTLATAQGERLGIVIAQNHRGWAKFLAGDVEGGMGDFADGLDISLALGHDEGVAYGLEAFVGVRAAQGDATAAGRLLGAALRLRRRKGILNPDAFEFYMVPVQALRDAGRGDEIDRAALEGLELSVEAVLSDARAR